MHKQIAAATQRRPYLNSVCVGDDPDVPFFHAFQKSGIRPLVAYGLLERKLAAVIIKPSKARSRISRISLDLSVSK
jgi:hypothetical protein